MGRRLLQSLLLGSTSVAMAAVGIQGPSVPEGMMMYNFTSPSFTEANAASWYEISDTVRSAGMSKATFSLQKSSQFQRAVMFAVINPQPNGAGFAGMKADLPIRSSHLSSSPEGIILQLRGQGQLQYWKVVLTDSDELGLARIFTYEQKFVLAKIQDKQFEEVRLPLAQFRAFYRGQEVEDAPPLDLAKIGTFGLQTFGGVYDMFKQEGVGAIEIDFIAFY